MSWTNPPTNFTQTIEGDLVERANEITLFAHRGVVLKSPVDTGRFRGNNIISVGAPVFNTSGTTSRDSGPALNRGFRDLAAGRNAVYTVRYVQNNLPYGPGLERGNSQQAPLGIYGVTFNEVRIRYTL